MVTPEAITSKMSNAKDIPHISGCRCTGVSALFQPLSGASVSLDSVL
ncbi:hypothetical protein ACGVWS_05545 [Enterobacteriaceae bacterium LUAb1]